MLADRLGAVADDGSEPGSAGRSDVRRAPERRAGDQTDQHAGGQRSGHRGAVCAAGPRVASRRARCAAGFVTFAADRARRASHDDSRAGARFSGGLVGSELRDAWPFLDSHEKVEGFRLLAPAEEEEFFLALDVFAQLQLLEGLPPAERRSGCACSRPTTRPT